MGSINAQRVAHKVSGSIRKGEKVNLSKILVDVGYSKTTANSPTLVTNTISYQRALAVENKPIVEKLDNEIQHMLNALSTKDYRKEETRIIVGSLDIAIKNRQLLSGGVTSRQVLVMPSELMNMNNIQRIEDNKNIEVSNTTSKSGLISEEEIKTLPPL